MILTFELLHLPLSIAVDEAMSMGADIHERGEFPIKIVDDDGSFEQFGGNE